MATKKEELKLQEARELETGMAVDADIKGLQVGGARTRKVKVARLLTYSRDALGFEWEQAWGRSCSLSVSWLYDFKGLTNRVGYKFDVSWTLTGRDLIEARKTAELYLDVVRLGEHIDLALREFDIVHDFKNA